MDVLQGVHGLHGNAGDLSQAEGIGPVLEDFVQVAAKSIDDKKSVVVGPFVLVAPVTSQQRNVWSRLPFPSLGVVREMVRLAGLDVEVHLHKERTVLVGLDLHHPLLALARLRGEINLTKPSGTDSLTQNPLNRKVNIDQLT